MTLDVEVAVWVCATTMASADPAVAPSVVRYAAVFTPTAVLPRRSGRLNVVLPSPEPNVVDRTPKSAE